MTRISFDLLGTFTGIVTDVRDGNGRIIMSGVRDCKIFQCDMCGALVNNTAIHETWHGGITGAGGAE